MLWHTGCLFVGHQRFRVVSFGDAEARCCVCQTDLTHLAPECTSLQTQKYNQSITWFTQYVTWLLDCQSGLLSTLSAIVFLGRGFEVQVWQMGWVELHMTFGPQPRSRHRHWLYWVAQLKKGNEPIKKWFHWIYCTKSYHNKLSQHLSSVKSYRLN